MMPKKRDRPQEIQSAPIYTCSHLDEMGLEKRPNRSGGDSCGRQVKDRDRGIGKEKMKGKREASLFLTSLRKKRSGTVGSP